VSQRHTADLESHVVGRLHRVFPDIGTDWPPT
jgi:hypothetical protein